MAFSHEQISKALTEMQLTFQTEGKHFLHASPGRYAEIITTMITPDDDLSGATVVATVPGNVPKEKRPLLYELFNLVHGQNIWNCRLHLDEEGRVLSLGKVKSWGRGFDAIQFGDIFFTVLVTMDRFSRSLRAITEENKNVEEAFEAFFVQKTTGEN